MSGKKLAPFDEKDWMTCTKKYGKVKENNTELKKVNAFCSLLSANKVKDSKEAFAQLPLAVQCLFLHYGWQILSKPSNYTKESYRTAFLLFKLFRSKEMKELLPYKKYLKLKTLDKYYKKALTKVRAQPTTKSRAPKTKYDKQYQRRPEPESDIDPLYLFYTSLYKENPKSPLAIVWLVEHGVYKEGSKTRKDLIAKYEKMGGEKSDRVRLFR